MSAIPVLEVEGLSVTLGGRTVLDEINIRIQPGQFIGLIGPNGAGKTTLLRVILGLIKPDRGTVRIAGGTSRGGKPRGGNRFIGYVPQKLHLDPDAPLRGRDLVALGLDGDRWGIPFPSQRRHRRIDEGLAAVDALAFADKPVGRLSGGEQQRLTIAQALLTDPKLLLLDEPLSNLDIRSVHEVVRLIAGIGRQNGIAVLLVAHDLNPLLGVMDEVLYLARGRAVQGRVEKIIQKDVLSRLYGYDVEVLRTAGRILVVGGADSGLDVLDLAGGFHCGHEGGAIS